MLDIFRHSDLPHDSVLVPVNTRKLTQVSIHVLQTVVELESINISQSELDVTVNDKFDYPKDLSAQVEGVSETGSLTLFGCEGFDWFQVEVVV
jgi:hypothetical protein